MVLNNFAIFERHVWKRQEAENKKFSEICGIGRLIAFFSVQLTSSIFMKSYTKKLYRPLYKPGIVQ